MYMGTLGLLSLAKSECLPGGSKKFTVCATAGSVRK